jgi:hypothetical protein
MAAVRAAWQCECDVASFDGVAGVGRRHGWWYRLSIDDDGRFKEREMILRFLALANRVSYYKGGLKRFLNDYMAKYAPRDAAAIEEQAQMFRQTMQSVYNVKVQKVADQIQEHFLFMLLTDEAVRAAISQATGGGMTTTPSVRSARIKYIPSKTAQSITLFHTARTEKRFPEMASFHIGPVTRARMPPCPRT